MRLRRTRCLGLSPRLGGRGREGVGRRGKRDEKMGLL